MPTPKLPATQLQRLRSDRQRSLADVALVVGVDRSVVSLWERSKREPSNPKHRRLYARVLDITVGELGRIIYEQSLRKVAS